MGSLQEERVPFDLDIRVWGMATDGRAFSQHARTQNISASGARLYEIEHDVEIGDTIGVQAGQKKTRCKVVWATNTRSVRKIQVGVQLLSQQECPWIALLPKTDRDAPPAAPGRRRKNTGGGFPADGWFHFELWRDRRCHGRC